MRQHPGMGFWLFSAVVWGPGAPHSPDTWLGVSTYSPSSPIVLINLFPLNQFNQYFCLSIGSNAFASTPSSPAPVLRQFRLLLACLLLQAGRRHHQPLLEISCWGLSPTPPIALPSPQCASIIITTNKDLVEGFLATEAFRMQSPWLHQALLLRLVATSYASVIKSTASWKQQAKLT